MVTNNSLTKFILSGLAQDTGKQKIIFGIFLILYLMILLNFLTVVTVKRTQTLGSPMYFFLFYLSFSDACFSTTTAPQLIVDDISSRKNISHSECMIQIFAGHFFGCMEILVLILMSFDQYVAVCKPLRYTTIMSPHMCHALVNPAWGVFYPFFGTVILALKLPFCGPNVIDHFSCDIQPLLKLAHMDIYVINLLIVFNSGAICLVSFVVLLNSYIFTLHSLRNQSAEGKRKALSTCTTHIIVFILFFVPCIFTYTRPPTTFPLDKMVAIFYTIRTPLLNPLFYSLRNPEVTSTMIKLWCREICVKLTNAV